MRYREQTCVCQAGDGEKEKNGEEGQKAQTSSYKINKFHSDLVLYLYILQSYHHNVY